ncbi:MAG: tetratricopeptide repeat protein [Bacteroidota bacterium]
MSEHSNQEVHIVSVKTDIESVDLLNAQGWKIRASFPKKTLEQSLLARELSLKLNYQKGIANSFCNSGTAYYLLSHYQLALSDLFKSKELFKLIGDKKRISICLRYIGNVYVGLNQFDKAIEYYTRTLDISTEINDTKSIAYLYGNMGYTYLKMHAFPKAIDFLNKSLSILHEQDDDLGIADASNTLAQVYLECNQPSKAFGLIQEALKRSNKIDHIRGLANSNTNLGSFYKLRQDFDRAIYHHKIALASAIEMGEKMLVASVYKNLAHTYQADNDYKKAYECFEQFEFTKSKLNDLNNEVAVNSLQNQLELEKSEKEKEIFRLRNIELVSAFKLIEEKNKNITDSLKYARHIQESLMPGKTTLDKHLQDYFVFYKSKDIVSGDFYWLQQKGDKVFFAVVDCTGHGVPGAFISLVGNNVLIQAVKDNESGNAEDVINQANILFNSTIRQTLEESTVKDGMDLSFCAIDRAKESLQFVGANHTLVQIRDGNLLTYRGNKFPIGIFIGEEVKQFTSETIHYKKGDTFYMFTDGYIDQFGEVTNRKFTRKRLYQILLEINKFSMEEQRQKLVTYFNDWRGNEEQLDDVLITGIRF